MRNFLTIIILCMFCSCDYEYHYLYMVDNYCDTSVIIELRTHDRDTVFIVPANTSQTLYTTTHGIEGRGGPFAGGISINRMAVSLRGQYGKRNYRNDESWTFSKNNDMTGVNTTTLTNENY